MVAKMKRVGWLLILVGVLAGCGVAIEVAEPIPTATPRTAFIDPQVWGGDVVRLQANPRFTFTAAGAEAELFPRAQEAAHVLMGNSLYLPIYFNVTWYGSAQSTVQLTLNVYRRDDARQAWTLVDSDSRTLSTVESPLLLEDGLGVGVYAESVGQFEVRTEISAVVRTTGSDVINREESNEFMVYVMQVPEDVPTDSDMSSPFGELSSDVMLYDYRVFLGGPCALVESLEDDGARDGLVDACSATEGGDVNAILESLAVAAQNADDRVSTALIEGIRGLIFVELHDFDNATIAFNSALVAARESSFTFVYTIALHNLLTTYLMRGDIDSANKYLFPLNELREQFYDEIGGRLTQANMGKWYDDYGQMDEAYWYFNDKGMPQATVLGFWLNK
jgi:hypothetical protein